MNELISVIVPVYNVASYLPRCIDSILSQTYKTLEIILVDDGSTDESGYICDEYKKKDGRIRVIHQNNKGLPGARNTGLEICQGEYIGFVDSDDWIEPEMYRKLLLCIKEKKTDFSVCAIRSIRSKKDYDNYNESSNDEAKRVGLLLYDKETVVEGMDLYREIFSRTVSVCNKLFSYKLINGIFFPAQCSWGEDQFFMLDVLSKAKSAVIVPKQYYNYYIARPGNYRTSGVSDRVFVFLAGTEVIYNELKSRGCVEASFNRIRRTIIQILGNIPSKDLLLKENKMYIDGCIKLARVPSKKDMMLFYKSTLYTSRQKRFLFFFRLFPYAEIIKRRIS